MRDNKLANALHESFRNSPNYARLLARTARGAKTELNLAKTGDRADILESSHRVIQEELAEERQNSQMLTAELTRERATRKTIEETIESHQKALEFERQRVDGQLARLAKRMDENHQELSTALRERTQTPAGEFATNPY